VTACKRNHQFVGPLRMQVWYCRLRQGKGASLRAQRYTLSNEFRNFKTACGTLVGASVGEYGTPLRDSLVCVRTDAALNESIEILCSGRVRSGGSCLHPHRQ